MTFKKILAGALLLTAIASPVDAARRRAVRHPAPPSHIMQSVAADDDLRYTNHGATVNRVSACIERTNTCITDMLEPGQSLTKTDLVRGLGAETANLELYATGPMEIRGRNDALPTALMKVERQNIPVMGAGQTFAIYTWSPQQAELAYLMSNGVERDRETIQLNAGTNVLTPRPLAVGEQLDLIPTGKTIMTSTLGGAQYRAKALSEAVGTQYLVGADATTSGTGKNIDPTAVLGFQTVARMSDGTGLVKDWNAVNFGTRNFSEIATGLANVAINGTFLGGGQYEPMLAWATTPPQTVGATAKNAWGVGENLKNASLNQLPDMITLYSTNNDATYTITGYKDDGTQTGTISGTATERPATANIASLKAAGATRITLIANDAVNGQTGQNNILLAANINGINKAGYQVEKPVPRVTGEEYVTKWLDILSQQYFYADNTMSKCLWQNNCGTPDYSTRMSQLLAQSSTTPFRDPAELLQAFKEVSDGNMSNDEFHTGFSPMNFDMRSNGNLRIYLAPKGTSIVDWRLNPPNKTEIYQTFRNFARDYFDANPSACGGTVATGCNLQYDPGFTNQLKPQ